MSESVDRQRLAEELLAARVREADDDAPFDLEALCEEHPEVAEELRELHARWLSLSGLLDTLGADSALVPRAQGHAPAPPSEGTPYQVGDQIAAGGMGAILQVWDRGLRRHVAMKVLRDGHAADEELRERFVEEAQITGQLDHPGVIPVHELGLDVRGRPYFTMTLVREGRTLGEIFRLVRDGDEEWSRTRALDALMRVCEAMAFAHSRGVLHRDLKPANVMVGRFGEVYVMDWGLAKVRREETGDVHLIKKDFEASNVVHSDRAERGRTDPESPLLTREGVVLGTPAYMPPEQARGDLGQLTARSDVYSVGAILYELLGGHPPYLPRGSSIAPRTLLQRIREGPPEPLAALAPEEPPELVAICERAMSRHPAQRYPDMIAMANDLRAFLEGRVVQAYRTGPWIEFAKWVQRNRALASTASAALVLTIAGLAGIAWVQAEAKQQQADLNLRLRETNTLLAQSRSEALRSAEQAGIARDRAEAESVEARRQRDLKEAVASFLETIFAEASPRQALGREMTASELLDLGARRISTELDVDAAIRTQLKSIMGSSYASLGRYEEATRLLEEAVAENVERYGEEHEETLLSMNDLGFVATLAGGLEQAETLLRRAVEGLRRLSGEASPATLSAQQNLAAALSAQSRFPEAEALLRDALESSRLHLGNDSETTLTLANGLGSLMSTLGRYEEAEELYAEGLAGRRKALGPNHPDSLRSLGGLAQTYAFMGRIDDAIRLMEESLEGRRAVFGEAHPDTLTTKNNLADLYRQLGRFEDAETLFLDVLDNSRKALGPDHPRTLATLGNLGTLLRQMGRPEAAEPMAREALEGFLRVHGEGHEQTLTAMNNLGRLYASLERYEEAAELYLQTIEGRRRLLGEEHDSTLKTMMNLAILYRRMECHHEAEELWEEILRVCRTSLREENPTVPLAVSSLGWLLHVTGRTPVGASLTEAALQLSEEHQGPLYSTTIRILRNLAAMHRAQGRLEEAEILFDDAWHRYRSTRGRFDPTTLATLEDLVEILAERGEAHANDMAHLLVEDTPADDPRLPGRQSLLQAIAGAED